MLESRSHICWMSPVSTKTVLSAWKRFQVWVAVKGEGVVQGAREVGVALNVVHVQPRERQHIGGGLRELGVGAGLGGRAWVPCVCDETV